MLRKLVIFRSRRIEIVDFKFLSKNRAVQFCTSNLYNLKDQQSINDSISVLCKKKRFHEALRLFQMVNSGQPNVWLFPSTYAHLFHACSSLKTLLLARILHFHLWETGCNADVVLQNHILNTYGKCGSLEDARMLFDKMPERNLVSWTSMISGFSQNHREGEAVEFYVGLLHSGLVPNQFALSGVVRACSSIMDFELGRQLHCHCIKLFHGCDVIVQNALISFYTKSDMMSDASILFRSIEVKDVISWGTIIAGFAQNGYEMEALYLFKEMISTGVYGPNEFHFGSAFSACGFLIQLDFGEQLYGLCCKFGLKSNNFAGCSACEMFASCGMVDHARRVFDQIVVPDLVSWNNIIRAFSHGDSTNEAVLYFSRMRHLDLQPDSLTIQSLLSACSSCYFLFQGETIHSYAVKTGFNKDVNVSNCLLSMYTKCSDLCVALDVFQEMQGNQDLVSWNTALTACLQHHGLEEVFFLFKKMRGSSDNPDRITLSLVLGACADLGYLEMSNQVFSYGLKSGLYSDPMLVNSLIDTFAKCGNLDDARKVLDLIATTGDVFAWTSLIVGYAQFGYSREALDLFLYMQSLGIKPNPITFVGVLTACSRDGLVDEGLHYYQTMYSRYDIMPSREHCSCVVDLLARAGRLEEAEGFIDQSNFKADIIMWKTLLAACRLRNNTEIGRRAAEKLLLLEPSNSGALALLCNLYASSGCWDDLARLRKSMRSIGVKKSPGKSWIELKGEIKVFIVEDLSHSESQKMHQLMEILTWEMMEKSIPLSDEVIAVETNM